MEVKMSKAKITLLILSLVAVAAIYIVALQML